MDGADDDIGMETGCWCCFTNSLPIIFLCMWPNEKPYLMAFISRQSPPDVIIINFNALDFAYFYSRNRTHPKWKDAIEQQRTQVMPPRSTIYTSTDKQTLLISIFHLLMVSTKPCDQESFSANWSYTGTKYKSPGWESNPRLITVNLKPWPLS